MKKMMITFSFFCTLLLSSCDQSSTSSQESAQANNFPPTQPQIKVANWAADYKGFIPCDSCEKRLVILQLHQDHTYSLKEVYFSKNNLREKYSLGTFTFDAQNPQVLHLVTDNTHKTRYIALHDHGIELLNENKKSFPDAEKYKIAKIQNIEVNNALKYVDIQADLFTTKKIILNGIESTQATYFFEINNHSDNALKLRNHDIVLVDEKNNEHIASIENSPLAPIKANTTTHLLISFTYPSSTSAAYINIK